VPDGGGESALTLVSLALALWATVVGTLAYLRSRPDLRVSVGERRSREARQILIHLVNNGAQPVTVMWFGLTPVTDIPIGPLRRKPIRARLRRPWAGSREPTGASFMPASGLPREPVLLTAGQGRTFEFDSSFFVDAYNPFTPLLRAIARDGKGRTTWSREVVDIATLRDAEARRVDDASSAVYQVRGVAVER
jgi:hypothetical protein